MSRTLLVQMVAGLSTPLHLAASLLGLSAAVGVALVGAVGPSTHLRLRPAGRLVAAGALLFATGHGLAGALVPVDGVAAWLRAGGLLVVAVGLTPRGLAGLPGAAVLVPVAPVPAAALAALAGVAAGLRALLTPPRLPLLGAGLLLWGAAEGLQPWSATASASVTIAGALATGGWLWQAGRARLRAKFATAFVASLLAVVLLMAGVLSGLGEADLVRAELSGLSDRSGQLTEEVAAWPVAARELAGLLSRSSETFLAPRTDEQLAELFAALFSRSQDFFVVLGPDGAVRSAWPPEVASGAFLLALSGSPVVEGLLAGRGPEGGLLTVGGRVVGIGGVRFPGPRAEDPPLGALLTGRVADDVWAQRTAETLGLGVLVEVGGTAAVASRGVEPLTQAVLRRLDTGQEVAAPVPLETSTRYAAAAVLRDPTTQEPVARIVTVSTADVIEQLEREQTRRLFLLALVGALLAGLVAAAVTGRLVAPVRRLTRVAAAVREGDLAVRAGVTAGDEVGELGRTFDEMTTSLAAQSTQLRQAAAVQARLRARLEALTASIGDALVAVDAEAHVVTFNRAAEALFGREQDAVLGLPLAAVLSGRGPGGVTAGDAVGAADSEDSVGVQLLLERGAGVVPVAATAAPVRDESGAVLGRVLVLRDVTREVELERMKTEFLSNVSHELRTPLTPIKGYAEVLLKRDVGGEATRRFAGQILESTQRLERIVGMIVDFAALDSGRLQPRREAVNVSVFVGKVLDDWRVRHPGREFRRRLAKALPAVLVDTAMLRRCLDELLDNAVKFSPGGEPVSVTAERAGAGRVRLSVRDRGVGIEPETLASVFTDFYQVDASETRHYGGLGLGLALVRRIMDGLGGEVHVESAPGAGTAFHLLLPVADETVEPTQRRRPAPVRRG